MPSAAALRIQIEDALHARFPAALTPAPRTTLDVAATAIPALDALLEGGLPVGAISEIVGPASSGRTSLILAFLAQRTREGKVCAWVDCGDAFDPESAAANGVALRQLLWVRCGSSGAALPPVRFAQAKTPAAPWSSLDQALRAVDLLLQAGGFASIVLDLGEMDPQQGMKIPLATWFRFRQAADRSRCSLLVLGRAAYAQSSAAVVLDAAPMRPAVAGGTVLRGAAFAVQRGRQRFAPQRVSQSSAPATAWSARAAWEMERSA
jgi:hypothetical protein